MSPPLCSFFYFPSLLPAKFNSVSPGPQLGLLAVYVRGEGRLAPRLCVRSGCIYICLALEPRAWNLKLCAGASWTCPRRLQQDLWTIPQGPMNGSQSHTAVHARLHHSPLFSALMLNLLDLQLHCKQRCRQTFSRPTQRIS